MATYTYDQQNRVTQVIEEPGQNQPAVTRDLAYDIHGNLNRETTSGGGAEQRIYINTFDPADRLTQTTLNGRLIQALEYLPGTDMVTQATDWKGAVTELRYDNTLRLAQVVLPTGHVKTFRHDKAGNRISETDGNGHLMQWQYDDLNRVVLQTNPLGHGTRFEYDANGNPLTRRNLFTGAGLSQQFDEVNRVTEQRVFNSSSGDQITRFAYQHYGRIVVETPPIDAAVIHTGNELGQLISREQAGITVGYTYDANGNIERVDHPMGFTTTRVNDGYGRLVTENAPLGYTQSAEYDIYGNTVRHTDPRGIVTTTVYDLFDRPTRRESTHETGSAEESWTYAESAGVVTSTYTDARGNTQTQVTDPLGRLTSFTDSTRAATTTQVWDAINLRQAVDMRGFTTTYTYDPLNRVLSQTDDGGTVTMAYDDAKRTITATDRRGIAQTVVHDETGNTLTTTRAGLTLVSTSYDRQNRPIRAVDGSGIVNTRGFDTLGRPTFEAVGPQRTEYRNYDDLGRPHEV